MNTEELCQSYEVCVTDIGFKVEEDGRLLKTYYDSNVNAVIPWKEGSIVRIKNTKENTITDQEIVLPTKKQLKMPGGSNIIFHPISEVLDRKMSSTLVYFYDQMICTTTDRFKWLIVSLGEVFSNSEDDNNYTPKQLEGLTFNKNFTKTAFNTLKRLVNKHEHNNVRRRILNMPTTSKTEWEGEPCRRVSRLTSALYRDLKKTPIGSKIWGVDVNEKQREAIIALFDYIFTGLEEGEYSYASNNGVAPFFDSMCRCFILINKRIDTLVKTYSTVLKKGWPFPELKYDWLDLLNHLGTAKKALTTQHGNIGDDVSKPKSKQQQNSLKVRTLNESATQQDTSIEPNVTETSPTSGGTYKPLTQMQPQYHPPQYQNQPIQQQNNAMSQYNQQPVYQPPQYQQPQQPVQPQWINGVPYIPGPNGALIPMQQQPQQNNYYQPQRNGLNR